MSPRHEIGMESEMTNWNTQKLANILHDCSVQLRNGDPLTREAVGPVDVVTIDFNPPVSDAAPHLEVIDLTLLCVGVDREEAEAHKDELATILSDYPDPDVMSGGPSYIAVGGEVGDQGLAFQLFAVGKVLGFWDVITPERMGFDGDEARNLAGQGFVMITGFRRPSV